MTEKTKKMICGVSCAAIAIAILLIICSEMFGNRDRDVFNAGETTETESSQTQIVESATYVEVEKTITSEVIQESLNDMGALVTAEYDLTMVETNEKTETVLTIFKSTSSVVFSYDVSIGAGIDFSGITVQKDDEKKRITIELPQADFLYCDIDYDSFQLYSEKEGLWSKFDMEDYNESLESFESKAKEKATEKGVLNRADDNAKTLIENFVGSLVDTSEYQIEWGQK